MTGPDPLQHALKLGVIASAITALVMVTQLSAPGWDPMPSWTAAAFAIGLVFGARWPAAGAWLVLPSLFVSASIFFVVRGDAYFSDMPVWYGGILGLVIGGGGWRWSLPARWRWPLVYWALAVAAVWPAIAWREVDGQWALFDRDNIGLSGLGGPPKIIVQWIGGVALTHMIGVLWLDTIARQFQAFDPTRRARFVRTWIWPLGLSIALSSAIAVYQGLVDVSFLSGHDWPAMHRAAGGLGDGNPYGAAAGMWVALFVALAASARSRLARGLAVVGALLCGVGLWMTASRMALLAGALSVAFVARGVAAAGWWRSRRTAIALAVGLVVAAALFGAAVTFSHTSSAVARATAVMPGSAKQPNWKTFLVSQFWNRGGAFGSAAVQMLRESPVVGIGVGSFQHFFPDYSYRLTGDRAFFDNAQSWPRHQLVEFGVLGSVGWAVFAVLLLRSLWRVPAAPDPLVRWPIKGALTALFVVSLVSMPSQNPTVALGFWPVAGWWLLESGALAQPAARTSSRWAPWLLLPALVAIFVALTIRVGEQHFRPPLRAERADWNFQYGLYGYEGAEGARFSWTGARAVDVFEVPAEYRQGWVKVTVHGAPPDHDAAPFAVTLRRSQTKFASLERYDGAPTTWYVAVRGQQYVFLQIDVSRTWRPSDFGATQDRRELGVAVDEWTFVATVPRDAVRVY